MIELKEQHKGADKMLAYILDAGEGCFAKSEMPASVAEEIVQRAETLSLRDEEGYELAVNGKMFFPKDAFELGEGDVPRPAAGAPEQEPEKEPEPAPGRKPRAGKRGGE